jgi:ATP synthase protein I
MDSANDDPLRGQQQDGRDQMETEIHEKQARKLRARRTREQGIWFGLGMMGTVGWSVSVPTLIGVALGIWIDLHWPSRISWTLVLLFGGLILGCLNAWFWVARQQESIEREKEDVEDE